MTEVSPQSLRALKETADLQWPLIFTTPEGNLEAQSCLRDLIGKRVVLQARWNGKSVLAKIFFRKKDYLRELAGIECLASAQLNSPALYRHWEGEGVWGVLLEWLPQAASMEQALSGAESIEATRALLERALHLIKSMHQVNVAQLDIHLDNFLISNEIDYVVDAGSVVKISKRKDALNNLALFFAQRPRLDDEVNLLALPSYGFLTTRENNWLLKKIEYWRQYRERKYLEKSVRTCTEFVAKKTFDYHLIYRRDRYSKDLAAVLNDPDAAIAHGELLKDGNSATVARVSCGSDDLIVKRYNLKTRWHAFVRAWRPSRAWASWLSAHRLNKNCIPTPKPIAVIERRWGPFRRQAYLITEYLDGYSLREVIAKKGLEEDVEQQIERIFQGMVKAKLSHGDAKATNWMVSAEGVQLIDLDSMRHHCVAWRHKRALRKDVRRFLKNWKGEFLTRFELRLRAVLAWAGDLDQDTSYKK